MEAGEWEELQSRDLSAADAQPVQDDGQSAFGPLRRVRYPGHVEGVAPAFAHRPGPLGTDEAVW